MAHILVYVEQVQGEPTPCSLETLGQARRLASALGATLFAAVALDRAPGYGEDDVLAKLASGGADKILLLVSEGFGPDPLTATWDSHGAALSTAWDICQPAIALLPATGGGRELGARAAARVGAAFLHEAFVELRANELVLAEGSGSRARMLAPDLDFPVVATIPPGRYATAAGEDEAEVEVLQAQVTPRFTELVAERVPAPLVARLTLPPSYETIVLPAPLAGCARTSDGTHKAVLLELETSKGALRIALGNSATEVESADFAAEGDAAELIERLFGEPAAEGARAERRR